jgi:hypothetical protein
MRRMGSSVPRTPIKSPVTVPISGMLSMPRTEGLALVERRSPEGSVSSGSADSRSGTPNRVRRKRASLGRRIWTRINSNRVYYGAIALAWVLLSQLFEVWIHLVSLYSPKETLERDFKEIAFWFAFCAFFVLFFSVFQPRPI